MTAKVFHGLVAALCGYEVAAIATRRLPTLSTIDKRCKHALSPVILGGLAVHFFADWPDSLWKNTAGMPSARP